MRFDAEGLPELAVAFENFHLSDPKARFPLAKPQAYLPTCKATMGLASNLLGLEMQVEINVVSFF